MPLPAMATLLSRDYGETPRGIGAVVLPEGTNAIIFWSNDAMGTFTVTSTDADGLTCVRIGGGGWAWKPRGIAG